MQLSANGIRRHMYSNTSQPKPNIRYTLVTCNKCKHVHFFPPDCPVEPVCPKCLYTGELASTMQITPTIKVSAAIGWVLIACLLGYVIGYGRH